MAKLQQIFLAGCLHKMIKLGQVASLTGKLKEHKSKEKDWYSHNLRPVLSSCLELACCVRLTLLSDAIWLQLIFTSSDTSAA